MAVPGFLALTLLSLAAWRTWVLIVQDDILNGPRRYVTEGRPKVDAFLICPYCSGFWVALGWWGAFQLWPHGSLVAASAAAISALVIAAEHVLSGD